MKKREGDPFMPPPEYGQSLTGFSVNILVRDMDKAMLFQREVLGVTVIYSDPDISIVRGFGTEWMIHADHTYDKHPMYRTFAGENQRGKGIEFRLHGLDPDTMEANARRLGFEVLAGSRDQPDHGLREVHVMDADGYVWVADIHLAEKE